MGAEGGEGGSEVARWVIGGKGSFVGGKKNSGKLMQKYASRGKKDTELHDSSTQKIDGKDKNTAVHSLKA